MMWKPKFDEMRLMSNKRSVSLGVKRELQERVLVVGKR